MLLLFRVSCQSSGCTSIVSHSRFVVVLCIVFERDHLPRFPLRLYAGLRVRHLWVRLEEGEVQEYPPSKAPSLRAGRDLGVQVLPGTLELLRFFFSHLGQVSNLDNVIIFVHYGYVVRSGHTDPTQAHMPVR